MSANDSVRATILLSASIGLLALSACSATISNSSAENSGLSPQPTRASTQPIIPTPQPSTPTPKPTETIKERAANDLTTCPKSGSDIWLVSPPGCLMPGKGRFQLTSKQRQSVTVTNNGTGQCNINNRVLSPNKSYSFQSDGGVVVTVTGAAGCKVKIATNYV